MSKRYREVLQDVETRRSRRAEAAADPVPVASTDTANGDDAAIATQPATAGVSTNAGGGVATLARPIVPSVARPAAPSPAVAPAATRGAPSAGALPTRRPDHPGNGPADADQPLVFAWRGRRYDVTRILGHWREEEGWWRRPDGEPIRIEQSDLWRVEAVRGGGMARDQRGVYELSRQGVVWRLDRVWD